MAKRTQSLMVLPWSGNWVTSVNEALIRPEDLTVADNIVESYSNEKIRRDGIDYDYDETVFSVTHRESSTTTRTLTGTFAHTGIIVGDKISIAGCSEDKYNTTSGTVTAISGSSLSYSVVTSFTETTTADTDIYWANKVVGGIDYWFGTEDTKAHYIITVLDNGAIYRTVGGLRNRITDAGTAWTLPLTEANLEVSENKVFIAVSGLNNNMKYWDGDTANSIKDVPAYIYGLNGSNVLVRNTSVSRSSAGTTRTIVFAWTLANVTVGQKIMIFGGPTTYKGTFTVASVSGATLTYVAGSSLTEGGTSDTTMTLAVDAPFASFIREHAGALWCNDKKRLDRIHYSGEDVFSWGGYDGLSGATDVGDGDGDPSGVTGIAPTFKGVLFVGKRTKLYRIDIPGQDFDQLTQTKVSNGIGFLSHQGIAAIDQDDIFFVSDRGIHSIASTDTYGDFSSAYISKDIQNVFVEDFNSGRKKYIKAAYLPEINSAVFSVTEEGSVVNNALYLYNVQAKTWRRWPNVEAEALIQAQDQDRRRIYLGTYRGRLAQTLAGQNRDTDFNGNAVYISNKIATGIIYPDGRPDTSKGFKSIRLIFKGEGTYLVTVKVKIDNFSEQTIVFSSTELALPLGTLVLGFDVMGGSYVTAPHALPIDGFGRGIKLTIEQNDYNTAIALQGFIIEYWNGQPFQETRLGDDK